MKMLGRMVCEKGRGKAARGVMRGRAERAGERERAVCCGDGDKKNGKRAVALVCQIQKGRVQNETQEKEEEEEARGGMELWYIYN